jgi:hypothetical protein
MKRTLSVAIRALPKKKFVSPKNIRFANSMVREEVNLRTIFYANYCIFAIVQSILIG